VKEIEEIYCLFDLYGDFVSAEPYGNGHINDTYCVSLSQGGTVVRYIFQRINHNIFKEPALLMENIDRICTHLQSRLHDESVSDASRRAMSLIAAHDGKAYVKDESGDYWRCYLFIEEALGHDIIENKDQAYMAARAFGQYQNLLSDLPGERLYETIPDFHNTPKRFRKFREVLQKDCFHNTENACDEIEFFLSMEGEISFFTDKLEKGILPERVTHNDTKLNNVLLDNRTGEGICIIDLDTSMPGIAAYDFGDLVRTSTCFSAEDEKDLNKVIFQKDLFEALIRGYLSSAAQFLTENEVRSLVFGGILMTYEVGLRFLTDYLEGNIYFKTKYEKHNLIRCRTQIKLTRKLLEERESLEELTWKVYKEMQQNRMMKVAI